MNTQADMSRLVLELPERTGRTQKEFAAELGVTCPAINHWDNGRAKPWSPWLKQIEDLARGPGERGSDLIEEFSREEES